MEGLTGGIEIRGNKYFKSSLLIKRIILKKGSYFNYDLLKRSIISLNEQTDLTARAVIMPGKEPATTDIIIEVKDSLPAHIGVGWDNFGSRFIHKEHYTGIFTHNNFLGREDKLIFQYLRSQANTYILNNGRYVYPVTQNISSGLSVSRSSVKLAREYKDTDVRGKSGIYSFFATDSLVKNDNFTLNFNLGFDYKDVVNYQQNTISSQDRLRVVNMGFDMDRIDKSGSGRTLFFEEFNFGIPNIMGGLKEQDPKASRTGAGGSFIKTNFNILRLQKMPFSTNLLWKNQIQLSSYILPATEQFQIGGIGNVRGYPTAEATGDYGYALTFEWSLPFYFIPKNVSAPFFKDKLKDTLKLVMFYDWASARLRRPGATEEKNKTLRGLGCGIRFNLSQDFSARIDFAWPLDNMPSDGSREHTWFQISKNF